MLTEYLPYPSLDAVAFDRIAYFSGDRDAQARLLSRTSMDGIDEPSTPDAASMPLDPEKVMAFLESLVRGETVVTHTTFAHAAVVAISWGWRRKGVSDPCAGGRRPPFFPRGSTCARGTHACSYAFCCWAGTCASRLPPVWKETHGRNPRVKKRRTVIMSCACVSSSKNDLSQPRNMPVSKHDPRWCPITPGVGVPDWFFLDPFLSPISPGSPVT